MEGDEKGDGNCIGRHCMAMTRYWLDLGRFVYCPQAQGVLSIDVVLTSSTDNPPSITFPHGYDHDHDIHSPFFTHLHILHKRFTTHSYSYVVLPSLPFLSNQLLSRFNWTPSIMSFIAFQRKTGNQWICQRLEMKKVQGHFCFPHIERKRREKTMRWKRQLKLFRYLLPMLESEQYWQD